MLLKRLAPLALGALLAACGGAPSARPASGNREAKARAAVAALTASFVRGQASTFFSHVDQSAFPKFNEFQQRVRQFLLKNRHLQLDVIVDTIVASGEEASVKAHWNRSHMDDAGAFHKDQGDCEFIVSLPPSGPAALSAVYGDSPF